MRYILALALVLLLSASQAETPDRQPLLHFTAVKIDRDHPARRQFGAMTLLGAWRVTSSEYYFGGISALVVRNGRFLALSDTATTYRFRFDSQARSAALRVKAVPGIFSRTNPMPDRDTESLAYDPVSRQMWVGFEASNTIRRFSPGMQRKRGWAMPKAMMGWPENGGPEAMVHLPDGRFLVFSEDAEGPGDSREAMLFPGEPVSNRNRAVRFYYRPPAGYSATDAALLADGRVLVLNRHYSIFDGFAMAITIVDPREIASERVVMGRELMRLAPPLDIDNMEAISIERDDAGEAIVWIMSDDNFSPLQQTLLFKFALEQTGKSESPDPHTPRSR